MLVDTESSWSPNSAPRAASDATFALWMMFLLGRHATFGHEPPTILRSTIAVRWPAFDSVQARYFPASPLPTTTRSYRLLSDMCHLITDRPARITRSTGGLRAVLELRERSAVPQAEQRAE